MTRDPCSVTRDPFLCPVKIIAVAMESKRKGNSEREQPARRGQERCGEGEGRSERGTPGGFSAKSE